MQRQFLRSGKILATFKLDIATVMQQPGDRHEAWCRDCPGVDVCRGSVLPQVGGADWPWRHCRQLQGLHQVRHQRHHQGGRRQDPAQERARRGRYRGVSLSCVKGNLLFIYPFKSIQDVVLWQLKMYLINYLPSSFIQPMLKVQEQNWGTFVFLKFEIAGDIERLSQLFLKSAEYSVSGI